MATYTSPPLRRASAAFLQSVVVLIGVGALVFLLWEPHLEGRNANATPLEVYFKDPFLAFAYVASIPFFVALYQAFKLLGYGAHDEVFSEAAVKALRTIKYCALVIIGFILVSVAFMPMADPDDGPPGVVMRVLLTFGAVIVAAGAAMFERIVQNAVDLKHENDFTV